MVTVVEYLRRKKDGPFNLWPQYGVGWQIVDRCGCFVYWAPLSGNAKQRRQQRRRLLRDLNE